MTRFDLHPEDLLERARRGNASDADLARLDQHLAECAVCRVEQSLSQRAALDAEPLRDEKLMVARLKRDVAERLQAPGAGRARRRGAVLAFSLGAVSLASVAAAATIAIVQRDVPPQNSPAIAAPPPRPSSKPAARPAVAEPAITAPAAPTPAEPAAVETTPKPAGVEAGNASELFSRANQARRDGKVKEAVRLYRVLQERYSGSGEELVSRVALGRLLLDRLGDSRGALVQFNSYLASPSHGALREEAMVGRALALGRIGRASEERAAWRALLDAWPRSAHAKRARSRLAELELRPNAR